MELYRLSFLDFKKFIKLKKGLINKVVVLLREELAEFFISKSFFKLYKLLKV